MAKTYELISRTTLASPAASITFSSIAASWTDLRLVVVGGNASFDPRYITFNGDTASNYSNTFLYGNGTTAASAALTAQPKLYIQYNASSTTIPCMQTVDVFSYAGSTFKTILTSSSVDINGSGTVERVVGLWRSTSAITSISLLNNSGYNFRADTTASLFGIARGTA
jgi:hypothetical protein